MKEGATLKAEMDKIDREIDLMVCDLCEEEIKIDCISFEDKIADLNATLLEQFEKSSELQKVIESNFEKI